MQALSSENNHSRAGTDSDRDGHMYLVVEHAAMVGRSGMCYRSKGVRRDQRSAKEAGRLNYGQPSSQSKMCEFHLEGDKETQKRVCILEIESVL